MLGDEGSDRGRHLSTGDTGMADLPLPEIGALEDSLPDSATRTERHGGRRRIGARPAVSGVEATAMSDLSLQLSDDSQEINRMRGRSRRRMVGTSFLVFALMGGGAAVGLWQLSLHRRGAAEGAAEGAAVPVAAPVAPAPRRVVAPPPAPARRASSSRGEGRPELPRAETREPFRTPPARIRAAASGSASDSAESPEEAAAAAREEERKRARERRWALPSGASDLPTPPPPTQPDPVQPNEPTVAPPPVNEVSPPTEETQPARETQPETPPREEPANDPKQIPPLDPPPRQEPPATPPTPTDPQG